MVESISANAALFSNYPQFDAVGPTRPEVDNKIAHYAKDRESYDHRLNETYSLSQNPEILRLLNPLTQAQLRAIRDTPNALVDLHHELIQQHIFRRCAVFFQQLVSVYGSRLHFEAETGAKRQPESAKALNIKGIKLCSQQAAHSSTLPALWAFENQAQVGVVPGRYFLDGSDVDRLVNSAIDLPVEVNQADSKIDGHGAEPLRERAKNLINRTSQMELTPEEALRQFLDQALERVQFHLDQPDINPKVRSALEHFQQNFQLYRNQIDGEPRFFEQLLEFTVDPTGDMAAIRSDLRKARFSALQQKYRCQTEISGAIDRVRMPIFQALKAERLAQGMNNYRQCEDAFRQVLVEQMPSEEDRVRMIKYYNLPAVTPPGTTLTAMRHHLPAIRVLALEISRQMEAMRLSETSLRSRVFEVMRRNTGRRQFDLSDVLKGWNQRLEIRRDFSAAVVELHTNGRSLRPSEIRNLTRNGWRCQIDTIPDSVSTIRRIENGTRVLDNNYARLLSKLFQVNVARFQGPLASENLAAERIARNLSPSALSNVIKQANQVIGNQHAYYPAWMRLVANGEAVTAERLQQVANELKKDIVPEKVAWSRSSIGRLERDEKTFDEQYARIFSRLLGIDKTLFIPQFFYA